MKEEKERGIKEAEERMNQLPLHKRPNRSSEKTVVAKGKSLSTNSSSSSKEYENVDSSTTPQEVFVGTGSAPSGKPRQFITTAVGEHFELLAGQKLIMEKGFDPKFLNANPFVKGGVKNQDWSSLVAANRKANSSFVREFYTEAASRKNTKVKGTTKEDEDEIVTTLVVEGKMWEIDGKRKCIPANYLTTMVADSQEGKSTLPMSHYCITNRCWSAHCTRGCLMTSATTNSALTLKKMKQIHASQNGDISATATPAGTGTTQINL
ncbi:hypothetical protein L6452_18359 [Arctium lappa]|uniref:Uncharacterized protein n=1 Tax=Arctium lappa TaxID=4217 RepID=A0ACB9C5Y9_ARCLA|nr:hypothetical protein L6452_18359 [Arctium lappa]